MVKNLKIEQAKRIYTIQLEIVKEKKVRLEKYGEKKEKELESNGGKKKKQELKEKVKLISLVYPNCLRTWRLLLKTKS